MSKLGNIPISQAFVTDAFNGNGSTTAFTMSVAPAATSAVLVAISGVLQDPSTYSVAGTTLTFSAAPPSGTGNISCRYLGIPASGVATTAYRTVTEFTATSGQTTFTVPSYVAGFINVYRNGALLGTADYTATNGTTVVLAVGAVAGDLVAVESFYVSSVLNAIPNTAGAVQASNLAAGAARANFGAGAVLQVAQGFKTDTFSTTSTTLVDVSSLSVTLTPFSSSSKFVIMVNMTYLNTLYVGHFALVRNGTEIGMADAASNRPRNFLTYSNATNANIDGAWVRESMTYLDSPATASSITYKIQASARRDGQGGTTYINRTAPDRDTTGYDPRGVSSILVMEIAA